MNLNNVVIKHKRFSEYGWNLKDQEGNLINTLSQGELGLLLGNNGQPVIENPDRNIELNTILDVRVGSQNGQCFWDAISILENKSQISTSQVFEMVVDKNSNHLIKIKDYLTINNISVNNGDIFIIKEKIIPYNNEDIQKYQYTAYIYGEIASDIFDWKAMDGNYNANNVYFDEDFTFTTNVGTVTGVTSNKKVEATGKSVKQFFANLFCEEIYATKETTTQPNISKADLINAGEYEVGTKIIPEFEFEFDPGKYPYGPETNVTVNEWKISSTRSGDISNENNGSFDELTVEDNLDYKVICELKHSNGDISKSNLGNNGDYKIASNILKATTKSIKGYRAQFCGALMTPVNELNNSVIRSLPNKYKPTNTYIDKFGEEQNGFLIHIPEGTKQVIIALYGKKLKEVRDQGFSCNNIIGAFEAIKIPVNGINEYTSKEYDVYVYSPKVALGNNIYECMVE